MVDVTQDWDEEDYEKTLDAAYDEYRKACSGDAALPSQQLHKTKQAFLSGIHWWNKRDSHCPDDLEAALRRILGRHNPFITQSF